MSKVPGTPHDVLVDVIGMVYDSDPDGFDLDAAARAILADPRLALVEAERLLAEASELINVDGNVSEERRYEAGGKWLEEYEAYIARDIGERQVTKGRER